MDTTNRAATLWNRYQDWLYYHADLEFYLDISRMRFDDRFVAEMQPKFEQAFQKMTALEGGAIANPDENRMVGHYWLRSPELSPTPEIEAEIIETLDTIEQFVSKIHSGAIKPPTQPKFTDVLSIGIGGSALGPQFVAEALSPDNAPMQIHFVDNTDPAGIDRVMARIVDRLDRTLVITISKSGSTPEPRNGMLEVQQVYAKAGLKFADHAVAITIAESILDGVAKSEGWLATFPMYDWVGGRTSELSAVGLLPAALQGIDIRSMLAGAAEMDVATRVPDLKTNPAALLALGWYFSGDGMGKKDMVVLPYKDSLLLFSRYLQQLVMESIGKQYDLDGNLVYQGIAVYGNKGSTDQHAYVQQLREGVANFFITFIEVLSDRTGPSIEVDPGVTSGDYLSGLIQGSRGALYENGRDSITITIGQVTPKMIGALIALYERAVGLYGYLVNVNAYHQPGVEAGKKAAAIVLDLQSELMRVLRTQTDPIGLLDLATQAKAADQIEAVYKIMRHLAANDRGVTLQGDLSKPASLSIAFKA